MKLYKLTDESGQTRNNTQWGPGIEHTATGEGELCGPGWLHAYTSPLVALLLNPIHAAFEKPRLWEADGDVGKTDGQLKVGCTRLRTIRELQVPKITTQQRVKFSILCALEVCDDSKFVDWAVSWLSGNDRTLQAAVRAAAMCRSEEQSEAAIAVRAAMAAAAEAARSYALTWMAAEAAEAAVRAAAAAAEAWEARAEAVARAAEAADGAPAAWLTNHRTKRGLEINLEEIAREAMRDRPYW